MGFPWGSQLALSWGLPRVHERCWSSKDGSDGNAASAGLCLLWLGFFRGGAGSDSDGGHFAASHSASRSKWGWRRWECSCHRHRWVIVMRWPARRGVSLVFVVGVGPARMAVVVTLPLLAYACCGWVFFEGVQAARAAVAISPPRALLLIASGGGGNGAVPVVVTVGLLLSYSRRHPGPQHPV